MSKDRITTILGMLVGGLLAAKSYIETSGDMSGVQLWMGLAMAVGVALWGYYSKDRER